MLGGIVAAPIAAWLVRIVPSHLLGVLVGGLIIFTNIRTLLTTFKVDPTIISLSYVAVGLVVIISIFIAVRNHSNRPNTSTAEYPNDQKQCYHIKNTAQFRAVFLFFYFPINHHFCSIYSLHM